MKRQFSKIFLLTVIGGLSVIVTGCTVPQVQSLRETASPQSSSVVVTTSIIEITKNGFKPSAVTIALGETIIFRNSDEKVHQIAADPHPTHDILPDLYSSSIYKGGSFRYHFTKKGTYGIHLEDNPSIQAKIIVE